MSGAQRSAGRVLAYAPFVIGVVEIALFVLVANWIGLGWTILLTLVTSAIGFLVLRREGYRAWRAMRTATAEGRLAGPSQTEDQIASTGAAFLAALLLALPGFLTDLAGLVLLIPVVRHGLGRRLAASTLRTFPRAGRGYEYRPRGAKPTVIEGEIVSRPTEEDDPDGT